VTGSGSAGGTGGTGSGARKAALFAALLAFLLFLPSLRNGFIDLDDPGYVTENPVVRAGLTAAGAKWAATSLAMANWHPMAWLSHMADVSLFGLSPAGHHATSVLLHALNAALLLLFLHRATGRLPESFLAALLFALHPMRVESVSWVAERKDLLCAFFFLLALRCYLAWTERPSSRPRYVALCLLFSLALLSKPMAVTFPFVLLLADYWPLGRLADPGGGARPFLRSLRERAVEKWPLFLLSALSCAVTVAAQEKGQAVLGLSALPPAARVANALVAWAKYVGLTLFPARLAAYYPLPPGGVSLPSAAGALLLLAVLTALAFRLRRASPAFLAGWLWFLGTLVPVIGFVQAGSQALASRYTYLPHAGLFPAFVFGISALLPPGSRWRRGAFAASLVPLAVLSAATVREQRYWKDSTTLFTRALEVTGPNNAVARTVLGVAESRRGNLREAEAHFREAVRIAPRLCDPRLNLAHVLAARERLAESEGEFREALACNPGLPAIRLALAKVLVAEGRHGEAARILKDLSRRDPSAAEPFEVMARIRSLEGDEEGALPLLREAVRRDPFGASARGSLGAALARRGRLDEGVGLLSAAVRLAPDNTEYRYNLGAALEEKGLLPAASDQLAAAARLSPDNSDILAAQGRVLARSRRFPEAAPVLEKALALSPGNVDVLFPLAMVRAGEGRKEEARRLFGEVLRRAPGHEGARRGLALLDGGAPPGSAPGGAP
jgi:Flp pilus assembly protein TadD